ncbi:MAG: ABC transporter ATP-binding protein [Rhizobiales bacterium]|nr:ABC transporter ATP-binding protein [Hyphomicrobiales bacterium]
MLEVEGLRSGYDGIPVLAGLSLNVAQGEFVGILGHNGMGKTTLLKTLVGLLPVSSGEIRFEGKPITRAPPHQRARRGLGYVPQGRGIFPGLTVLENLRFAAAAVGRGKGQLDGILAEFPRLMTLLDRPGSALSGGEQQLLALARSLVQEPRMVLLDEPTEGIQPSIIEEIVEQLKLLRRQRGLTVLLVEQNIDFIKALSDRVLLIQKGAIMREFSAEELSDSAAMGDFGEIAG